MTQRRVVVTQPALQPQNHSANLRVLTQLADTIAHATPPSDFVVLPECCFREPDFPAYTRWVQEFARITQACVIGGSVHARTPPAPAGDAFPLVAPKTPAPAGDVSPLVAPKTSAPAGDVSPMVGRGDPGEGLQARDGARAHSCAGNVPLYDPTPAVHTNHNAGLVIAPDGEILAHYSKRHPYGDEVEAGVQPGTGLSTFSWRGTTCAVVICADLWDSRLLTALATPPDLLFVVAATVSEEHGPAAVRRLWQSLAVTRAFECASCVAISDWAETPFDDRRFTCGVAGLADPADGTGAFQPLAAKTAWESFPLDLPRLRTFRTARQSRHFYFFTSASAVRPSPAPDPESRLGRARAPDRRAPP